MCNWRDIALAGCNKAGVDAKDEAEVKPSSTSVRWRATPIDFILIGNPIIRRLAVQSHQHEFVQLV